tara:strand:+ start:728 stop:1012 length:285 start_codon:yes stop_codon:yes gene_type:complete
MKTPTDNRTPKKMIRFPRLDGAEDSITTIYKNHTRIPAIAMTILIKNSPRNRAVKKPTIAPKGIIYPNPDLTSLFITKLRFYLRITSKIDLFKN